MLSSGLEWIATQKLHASVVIHISDDFSFIAPSNEKCRVDLNNFFCLCQRIGVSIANEKITGPAKVLRFAGISLVTALMEACLPKDKLEKCRSQLTGLLSHKRMSLKELQTLIGLLNFACCVVVPGRAFLRPLIDPTKGIPKPHHHVRLTKDTKHDINVWHDFLRLYNGKSFSLSSCWETSKSLNLFTDAAGSLGYEAIFGTHWFFREWPDGWKNFNITLLEFFPIVLAVEIWGSIMRDRFIVFVTCNQAVVEIISRQTSKDPCVMVLLRHFVLCTLKYNILFPAKHIAGSLNHESDALSPLQVEKFRFLAPYADDRPTPILGHLQTINWHFT